MPISTLHLGIFYMP